MRIDFERVDLEILNCPMKICSAPEHISQLSKNPHWELPKLQISVIEKEQVIFLHTWQYSNRPGGSKIELVRPSIRVTACESTQQLGGRKTPKINFLNLMLWDRFWGHFWTLLQPYLCSSWQARFWFKLVRPRARNIMVWFERRVYFCTSTKFVLDRLSTRAAKSWAEDREWGLQEIVSANVTLGMGIFISKFAQPRKRRTLQRGLYIRTAAASDERCS